MICPFCAIHHNLEISGNSGEESKGHGREMGFREQYVIERTSYLRSFTQTKLQMIFFQGSSTVLVYSSARSSNSYFHYGITSRNQRREKDLYVCVVSIKQETDLLQNSDSAPRLVFVSQSKFPKAEWLHPLSLHLPFLNTACLSVYR